jgi:AcrR family transcriptional regulator
MVTGVMVAEFSSREKRARETRRRIFQAARELFERQGYSETTIDAIVKKAGVAKGTFFVHFATKDAVMTELVGIQTRKALEARAVALATDGPRAALRATVLTLGSQAGASRGLSRAVLAATLEKQHVGDATGQLFAAVFEHMVGDAQAAGASAPELLARELMTSYLGAVLSFTTTTDLPSLEALLAPLVDRQLQDLEENHDATALRPSRRRR